MRAFPHNPVHGSAAYRFAFIVAPYCEAGFVGFGRIRTQFSYDREWFAFRDDREAVQFTYDREAVDELF